MRPGKSDERGAVAVFTAVTLVLLLVSAAFAIDIGMQRVGRSDMQSLADVVSMDLARALKGRDYSEIQPGLQTLANESRDRNKDVLDYGSHVPAVHPVLGTWTQQAGFVPITAGVPNAVRVTAGTTVSFAFGGVTGVGSGDVARAAVSTARTSACYSASSFALGLASKDSMLRAILGPAASLRVLSSAGLANASVSLLGLSAALGAGTPDQLLNLQNVTVGDLLTAWATVVSPDGTADAQAQALGGQITALKTDLGLLADTPVDFAQLLDLGQGGASALDADVHILDLVTGSVIVANKVNGIAVPDLALTIPLVGTLNARLYLTQPPVTACNGGTARSVQGYIEVSGGSGALGICPVLCVKGLKLVISLANASATLADDWACEPSKLVLNTTSQTLADVRLTANVQALLLPLAQLDTGAPTSGGTGDWTLPLPDAYDDPVETSSGHLGLDLSDAKINVAGIDLSAVTVLLQPIVELVDTLVTQTLLPAIGLTTDGADLQALRSVNCSTPKLVG